MCHQFNDRIAVVVPSRSPDRRSLSPRMIQTLRHLLSGLSEKETAAVLGLSIHTVHVYVKEIHKRFGVESRAELFARFVPLVSEELLVELIQGGQLLWGRATVGVWIRLCAGTGRSALGHSGGDEWRLTVTPSPPEGASAPAPAQGRRPDAGGAAIWGRRSRPHRCRRSSSLTT